jgi:hypothetical protein
MFQGWRRRGFRLHPFLGLETSLRRLRTDLGEIPFHIWTRGQSGSLGHRCERCGRRIRGASISPRSNPMLSHSETGCATADAAGASGDRARDHLRDDDAHDAEPAGIPALMHENLRLGSCVERRLGVGSGHSHQISARHREVPNSRLTTVRPYCALNLNVGQS